MQPTQQRAASTAATALTAVFLLFLALSIQPPTTAQAQSPVADERPFQLPFTEPSSLDTWMMAQPYGNTTGAFRRRFTTYGASGGIHFGLDLSAPCGTPIVAMADGVVFAVDGPFGSPPHNLMIDHPQLGYAVMYGHLLQAPNLQPGQLVEQGQIVAHTGDSDETCYGRPHLHLEIRDLNHIQKFNPTNLIEANWDNLALFGSSGRDFARDLTDPRKWQSLYDQPGAQTGGPIVNDFAYSWPFEWDRPSGNALTPPARVVADARFEPADPAVTEPESSTIGRRLTASDCCTSPFWTADSSEVRFIDQPAGGGLGIWGVNVDEAAATPRLVTPRLGETSPDGRYLLYPDRAAGLAVVERLADGERWPIDTGGRSPHFTPDSRHIIWTAYDDDAPRDTRLETLWLANLDGNEARAIFSDRRTDALAWLSDTTLLMSRRFAGTSDEQLFSYNIEDGSETPLLDTPEPRGMALSPDKRYLVYYLRFESSAENGLWLFDIDNPAAGPEKLPFFGAYRWRDGQKLIYVPYDADADEHIFYEYDVTTGESRQLIPAGSNITIANNDWRVSPDGGKITLVAADGPALNGIRLLEID